MQIPRKHFNDAPNAGRPEAGLRVGLAPTSPRR
jgi:hypothetical protein